MSPPASSAAEIGGAAVLSAAVAVRAPILGVSVPPAAERPPAGAAPLAASAPAAREGVPLLPAALPGV